MQYLKKVKHSSQSGRSMLEMLGVLAIIGVLAVGGLTGYQLAMCRYRANESLNIASKYAAVLFMDRRTHIAHNGNDDAWFPRNLDETDIMSFRSENGNELENGVIINTPEKAMIQDSEVVLSIDFKNRLVCESARMIVGSGDCTQTVVQNIAFIQS